MNFRFAVAALVFVGALFASIEHAFSHGFAGSRFFPATLSTDDPFVGDELSLPTVSSIVKPDEGGTRDTELSVDITKRITPSFCWRVARVTRLTQGQRHDKQPLITTERLEPRVAASKEISA